MKQMWQKLLEWITEKRATKPGDIRVYKGKNYIALPGDCETCSFKAEGCYSVAHKVVLGCCIMNKVCFKELGDEKSEES